MRGTMRVTALTADEAMEQIGRHLRSFLGDRPYVIDVVADPDVLDMSTPTRRDSTIGVWTVHADWKTVARAPKENA